MPTKIAVLLLLAALGVGAETFSLKRVTVVDASGPTGKIFVRAAGTPVPASIGTATNWTVTTTPSTTVTISGASWSQLSQSVTLEYNTSGLSGHDPHHLAWTVTFQDRAAGTTLQASTPPKTTLSAPKGKDDADLYFFGSYLAGVQTKPIYTIDAKVSWVPEVGHGYFFGLESAISTNTAVMPPVTRSSVDPDSITADLAFKFMRGDLAFNINPARGEFSRKTNTSGFVPAASVQWVLNGVQLTPRNSLVLYPSFGVEAGTNLNKPATLFNQPVDLSHYDAIARVVPGAYAAYYIERAKPDPSDPYLFEIYVNYSDRVVFKPEPFIKSVYSGSTIIQRTTLGTNPRPYVEAGINWNAGKLVSITAKYKYGSLPPLFEFVDHQVTLGITFKSKLPKTASFGK